MSFKGPVWAELLEEYIAQVSEQIEGRVTEKLQKN